MFNEGAKTPSTPDDYVPSEVNTIKREPAFESTENPGQWSRYCYNPKFNPKGVKKYVHHVLPNGAIPVRANKEGKRKCGAWEFQYAGWENADKNYYQGATTRNLFLEEMRGELDEDVLTTLVLTANRMKRRDALLLFQVLWPMFHTSKSEIVNDPRFTYFTSVELFTNIYKFSTVQGGSYGHKWKNVFMTELLPFNIILKKV